MNNSCRVGGGVGLSGLADLRPDAVYLSPLNRRCRFVPMLLSPTGVAHFVYDTPQGAPVNSDMADGFSLRASNVRLMRQVG